MFFLLFSSKETTFAHVIATEEEGIVHRFDNYQTDVKKGISALALHTETGVCRETVPAPFAWMAVSISKGKDNTNHINYQDIMNGTPKTISTPMDKLYEAMKGRYSIEIQTRDDTIALLQENLEAEQNRAEKFSRLAREHLKRSEEAEARSDEAERQVRELQSEIRNLKRQNAELQLRLEGIVQTPVTNNLNFMSGSQANITEIHDNKNVSA